MRIADHNRTVSAASSFVRADEYVARLEAERGERFEELRRLSLKVAFLAGWHECSFASAHNRGTSRWEGALSPACRPVGGTHGEGPGINLKLA